LIVFGEISVDSLNEEVEKPKPEEISRRIFGMAAIIS
jgi:hypothetical protein